MTDRPQETNLHQIHDQMRQVAQICLSCKETCESTLAYCLQTGGEHARADHLRNLQDCVEICQTTANTYLRGSNLHPYFGRSASLICLICAQSCEQIGPNDQVLQACAKSCRQTMEALRRVGALSS